MATLTYTNPVWPDYFADPFVLRTSTGYWAYGTGPGIGGREFPVLHSPDLVTWTAAGAAVTPIDGLVGGNFWAPEVAERDGKFYLYYSAAPQGSDAAPPPSARRRQPRRPARSSTSADELFPGSGFSIDAHPVPRPRRRPVVPVLRH